MADQPHDNPAFQMLVTALDEVRQRAAYDRGELDALPRVAAALEKRLQRHAELEASLLAGIATVAPAEAARLAAEPVAKAYAEFSDRLSQHFVTRPRTNEPFLRPPSPPVSSRP